MPAKTLLEFIAYAKANPGKLNFGFPSFGTTPHLSVERLKLQAGIDLVHVPFQGAPQAVQALLRNDIQLYLRGIAVGHLHRPALMASIWQCIPASRDGMREPQEKLSCNHAMFPTCASSRAA